jgi:threonine dehydrogenase-like Zn-dependent dehydrogenase
MITTSAKARSITHRGTMQAAVLQAPRQMRVLEVPIPQPSPTQVRIALEGCGVCASNLPPWEGRPWFEYPMAPGALGHEGWGRIDALGSHVTGLRLGQRVAFLGYHSFAQYDVAESDVVVELPPVLDDIPFPGEPLACAINVLKRACAAPLAPGTSVVVLGIGFLGAMLVQMLARQGAEVIALTRRPFALDVARRCGAVHTFELNDPAHARQAVLDLTGGAGAPCVIECTGKQEALDLAGEITAIRGRLVVAGYHQDGLRQVNVQQWNWRGIDVINAHERDPSVYARGLREAVKAVVQGLLLPAPLYTHRFTLESLDQALEATAHRPHGFLKALIHIQAPSAAAALARPGDAP